MKPNLEKWQFPVLSIDAWADGQECPNCGHYDMIEDAEGHPGQETCRNCHEIFEAGNGTRWTWNNWFNTDQIFDTSVDGLLDLDSAMEFFTKHFIVEGQADQFEIFDDQYNLVLVKKSNAMPILAIAYGSN